MMKLKDGYKKLIGTTYTGSSDQILLSDGGNIQYTTESTANTIVQRNANSELRGKLRLDTTSSYLEGRNKAPVANTHGTDAYQPLISSKVLNGSWEIVTYQGQIQFSYITDEAVSSGSNGAAHLLRFPKVTGTVLTNKNAYIGTTAVQTSSASQALTGITSVNSIKIQSKLVSSDGSTTVRNIYSVLGDLDSDGNVIKSEFWLKPLRGNFSSDKTDIPWITGSYAAGIAFGGGDTKGVMSVRYDQPDIRFAGANPSSQWWMTVTGSHNQTYNLNKQYINRTSSNAVYPFVVANSSDTTGDAVLYTDINSGYGYNPSKGEIKAAKFTGKIEWDNINNKPSSFTPAAHDHNNLKYAPDVRNDSTQPSEYKSIFKFVGIKTPEALGLTQTEVGSYASLFGWKGYVDNSGPHSWELISTNKERIYVRSGAGIQNDGSGTEDWTNWKAIAYTTDNFSSNQINKLTGYTKATAKAAITTTDSLNTALGKLEFKADTAYDLVKGAYDGDGTIENLAEILKVLEGVKDTDTIQAIVGKYLPLAGGTLTGNLTASNAAISTTKDTTKMRMFVHGGTSYIQSGNSDWTASAPLTLCGYNGTVGTTLKLRFSTIQCRDGAYTNIDSGNYTSYNKYSKIEITNSYGVKIGQLWGYYPDGGNSQLVLTQYSKNTSDNSILTTYESYYLPKVAYDLTEHQYYIILTTKNAYIGKTKIQQTAAAQGLSGIGNILPDEHNKYYLGAAANRWYVVYGMCGRFATDVTSPKFITEGGTASQFVKGDGSLDSTTYATFDQLNDVNYRIGKAAYNFGNGYLVKTKIPTESNTMVYFRIEGNDYGLTRGNILTTGQFYNYKDSNKIINASAHHHGYNFGNIQVFCYDGYIHMWWQQPHNYQTYIIHIYTANYPSLHNKNVVDSITNAAMPVSTEDKPITRLVEIVPMVDKVEGGGETWGSNISITLNGVTKTLTIPANPNTDTKNTAGSTASDSKLFLIGATTQAANPQTYSNANVYATAGKLYCKGLTSNGDITLYSESGNSPSLIFQRGILGGNSDIIDWKMVVSAGHLKFQSTKPNTSDWIDVIEFKEGSVKSIITDCAITASKFIGTLQGNADTATKLGTTTVGSSWKPIYLKAGAPTECQIYKYGTNSIATITADGILEAGKYINFHAQDGVDYDVRIIARTTDDTHGAGLTLSGITVGTFKGNITGTATSLTNTVFKENDDLNNFTEAGVYSSKQTSVCRSLVNKPSAMPGGECVLEVIHCEDKTHVIQKFIAKNGNTEIIYYRAYNNDSWSTWHTVARVSDIPTKISELTNDSTFVKGVSLGGTYQPIYVNAQSEAVAGTSYAKAIKGITRSGNVFTYTCIDGTTGTFNQQDTTYDLTAQKQSLKLPATKGWYRIATSKVSVARCIGDFEIEGTIPGWHTVTKLNAAINFEGGPGITVINTAHRSVGVVTQARIVYHLSYNQHYAYLEVYLAQNQAITLTTKLLNGYGWSLIQPVEGSIPEGYTHKTVGLLNNTLTTTGDLMFEVNSGNSPAVIFKRGVYDDGFIDWKLYVNEGILKIQNTNHDDATFKDVISFGTQGAPRIIASQSITAPELTSKGDIYLKSTGTNPSGSLVFQRGSNIDTAVDWKLQCIGSNFFIHNRISSETWNEVLKISTNSVKTITTTYTIEGNITGTASKLASTQIINKSLTIGHSNWTDTGYTFADLATGTYAVQVTSGTNLVASGIMSVYNNLEDTIGDEIPLHVYGTADWRPYLRTYQNKLQISSNDVTATSRTITIKIAQII